MALEQLAANLEFKTQTTVLGAFTRVPKGMGWKPSYFQAWENVWQDFQNGKLTTESYETSMQLEEKLLQEDYQQQESNLAHWPECHVDPAKLGKSKQKKELKKWLKSAFSTRVFTGGLHQHRH